MKTFSILDFGGVPDGKTDNSLAFKNAFSAIFDAGGGILQVPEGEWKTGPIEIPSFTTLELQKNALLSFIPDPNLYPPVFTRWEGVECFAMHPCVFSSGKENVSLIGEGTIEGNGKVWWDLKKKKKESGQKEPQEPYEKALAQKNPDYKNQPGGGGGREIQFLRPSLIEFSNCKNVALKGVTIKNSPFWTVHPLYCDELLIDGVSIENPKDAPNTDGIDIDSCTNVQILNCSVSVGDDGICLKSGSGPDGIRVGRPTENVTIKNCTVRHSHGGIVLGSETAAGINNVLAENCNLLGTDRGIRIKSRRGRGGEIFNITLKNLTMENNLCPIAMNMYYKCGITDTHAPEFSLEPQPIVPETPNIHDIFIEGCTATGCKASAGFIVGLPERPIKNLSIKNCDFSTDENSPESPMNSDMFYGLPEVSVKSFRIRNAPNAKFENVSIHGPKDVFIYE